MIAQPQRTHTDSRGAATASTTLLIYRSPSSHQRPNPRSACETCAATVATFRPPHASGTLLLWSLLRLSIPSSSDHHRRCCDHQYRCAQRQRDYSRSRNNSDQFYLGLWDSTSFRVCCGAGVRQSRDLTMARQAWTKARLRRGLTMPRLTLLLLAMKMPTMPMAMAMRHWY